MVKIAVVLELKQFESQIARLLADQGKGFVRGHASYRIVDEDKEESFRASSPSAFQKMSLPFNLKRDSQWEIDWNLGQVVEVIHGRFVADLQDEIGEIFPNGAFSLKNNDQRAKKKDDLRRGRPV